MTVVGCLHCGRVVIVVHDMPTECAHCHGHEWRTMEERADAEVLPPLPLTREDRRFLAALHISSDDL